MHGGRLSRMTDSDAHAEPAWVGHAGRVANGTVLFVFLPLFVVGNIMSLVSENWPSDEPTGSTLVFSIALMASVAVALLSGTAWLFGRLSKRGAKG